MAHHHHHHIDPDAGDRRMYGAIAVNLGLTLAQIVGGFLSGSLALIADGIHNLSDAASLVIAFAARKIARRPADADMPFGYRRIEVVAALINYTSLTLIGLFLAYEAVMRFFDPQPVLGWMVVALAAVALLVDLVTAWLTYRMAKDSVNIRAAFLHNLADAASSVAVIVAGTFILLFGWVWVDPAITLMIAGYILWMSLAEMPAVIRTLMLGRPEGMAPDHIVAAVLDVDGVTGVHNAHLWQMQEHAAAFQAHIIIRAGDWAQADAIKAQIKARLAGLDIHTSTLELECAAHACTDAPAYGT
ncbi:MAG: cation diffusion facilitator family transporter [Octadecabacter sp.]|nr:cation diffusion facilitator family transporter [Octadecabacter sp.]